VENLFHLYAVLWLSNESREYISDILINKCGVPSEKIVRNPHLTVYHSRSRRPLNGLDLEKRQVNITMDIAETRFMTMTPGGENPRPDVDPSKCSIGIRLKKGNIAIPDILAMRREFFKYETETVIRPPRQKTTDWTNAFGARSYQPHIKLIFPENGLHPDLTKIGSIFRSKFHDLEFDRLTISSKQQGSEKKRP
jgi:hypothetical protein